MRIYQWTNNVIIQHIYLLLHGRANHRTGIYVVELFFIVDNMITVKYNKYNEQQSRTLEKYFFCLHHLIDKN